MSTLTCLGIQSFHSNVYRNDGSLVLWSLRTTLFKVLAFERCEHGWHLKNKPQSHAMGVIANKIQYKWLIVVIRNVKMSQHNYDLEIPLWDNGKDWCSLHESLGIHVGKCPCEVDCNMKILQMYRLHCSQRILNGDIFFEVFVNINKITQKHILLLLQF